MHSARSPSLQEFVDTARREFGYLCNDYGFVQEAAARNPFSVVFTKDEVVVVIEGINWGFGANVLLSYAEVHAPLWAIARAKGRHALPVPGQIEQLKASAILLREVAEDVLKGDASDLAIARQFMDQASAEARTPKVHRLP